MTAIDLQTDFLMGLSLPNLVVLRHDVRTDDLPEGSFDFIHLRAVLMHVDNRMAILRRVVSWLAPGGWLLAEEPDFGMWQGDYDPMWSAHPRAWHESFPHGSRSQGRALLRQIRQLDLADVGADAELDIVAPGTPLAEFYRLSLAAVAGPSIASGALTPAEVTAGVARPTEPSFLACGFAFIARGDADDLDAEVEPRVHLTITITDRDARRHSVRRTSINSRPRPRTRSSSACRSSCSSSADSTVVVGSTSTSTSANASAAAGPSEPTTRISYVTRDMVTASRTGVLLVGSHSRPMPATVHHPHEMTSPGVRARQSSSAARARATASRRPATPSLR